MRALIANLQDKFAQLQQREKLFVTVGAALVVMAIIYSTLLPQLTENNQLTNQQADLQADLLWLQQQQAVVARLANSCASSQASVDPAKTVLTRLIRRNQLRLQNLREDSQGLVLRFSATDANRIVRTAHQIACQGFAIESLQVTGSAAEANQWDATLEVSYVN